MKRDFCLGSEWLYYKIYTGVKTSDFILLEQLEPIISNLLKKKIISKWFFIRYKDTDEHLRVRFLLPSNNHLPKVIKAFYPVFEKLMEENLIWKIQTDTYKRELERYGENTIEDSEFLFWKDSEMILRYISLKREFQKKEIPLFFSFCAIDSFLNSFSFTNFEKYTLMNNLQNSFKEEFSIDKDSKKQLDKEYRRLFNDIKLFLNQNVKNDNLEFFEIINEKQNQISDRIAEIKIRIQFSISDFVASHIHMMINRQYNSKQRMYELIIYDHLCRYYKTLNYKI
ncbi:thiopeptide-type bacteriocin biosynthesis protein [Flavobacterium sp.]|uniref:thiopeptide-type bacteriocin biosynthesis protein n=1 Tax=Flavobacterium sp. TaxID=239 RepID=UPI0031CFBA61